MHRLHELCVQLVYISLRYVFLSFLGDQHGLAYLDVDLDFEGQKTPPPIHERNPELKLML